MKSLNVAIFTTLLCATHVFAAPSDLPSDIALIAALEEVAAGGTVDPAVVIEQYECLVNVLREVAVANGQTELWTFSKSRFERNIARWKKCGSIDTDLGFLCHTTQAVTAVRLVNDFLSVAHKKDPYFAVRVAPKYLQKCAKPQQQNERAENVTEMVEGMKCIIDTTVTKLTGTPAEKVLSTISYELNRFMNAFRRCNPTNKKCLMNSASKFQDSINGGIFKVRAIDETIGKELEKLLAEKCDF